MPTLQKFSEVTLLEKLVLDPSEVATSRTELQIHSGSIRLSEAGVDWGDAEIAAFMAERERGEAPVDFRIPNRKVTVPLMLGTTNGTTFNAARTSLQAKVARLQSEGGWLKRETSDGRKFYLDVVNATLNMPEHYAHLGYELDVVLTLECIPDLYGSEVTLSAHTESTNPELIFTETAVTGDYPGRVRIVVDELQGVDQLGLLWGVRSRHYSSASTARLVYAAGTLGVLDAASSSGGTITHSDLGTGWTPFATTNIGGTTFLTQTGSYRVWANCESVDGDAVRARFVWDVGDLTLPVENPPVSIPGAAGSYLLDLGEVRLDPAPVGTHRWQGQLQAAGDVGGEEIKFTRLRLQPLDEGAGRLAAPITATQGLASYVARDEFNQSPRDMAGGTAAVGGVWAGAGSSNDFAITGGELRRLFNSDSNVNLGRYGISGVSAFAAQAVQVDLMSDTVGQGAPYQGVLARYTDVNNWLMVTTNGNGINDEAGQQLLVRKRVSTTVTVLDTVNIPPLAADADYSLRLSVDAAGRWNVWFWLVGGQPGSPVASGQDAVLATGGTLASGKPGVYDANTSVVTFTRTYDNFAAWAPISDAVLLASQSAELRTDGMFRYSSDGLGPGPVSKVIGDLPRLPSAGLESRTVEVFLKASRGDLDQLPDSGTDDLRATVKYRPSWLMIAG